MGSQRRDLRFDDFGAVFSDIDAMSRTPHASLGNWNLAQTVWHLAETFRGSVDGFRLRGHHLRRIFLGRRILSWTLKNGIPRNITLDERLNPPAIVDLTEANGSLRLAVDRYGKHTGRLKPHPVFGRLNRENWDKLHCFHCAHHLSFLVPLA